MKYTFAENNWNPAALHMAHTWRYEARTPYRQGVDCIYSNKNPDHPEGFDNVSLVTKETYTTGDVAAIRCSFEGLGCPEIILVPALDFDETGARYGACFEIVLYEKGINVWRHYRQDGKCSWHNRLRLTSPLEPGKVHALQVEVLEHDLAITLNGVRHTLRTEDLPEKFHFGITMCEGIARVYEFETAHKTGVI